MCGFDTIPAQISVLLAYLVKQVAGTYINWIGKQVAGTYIKWIGKQVAGTYINPYLLLLPNPG